MDVLHIVIAAMILFGSSMVQAIIGFAFNLIAIPLLIWAGFSLAESVAMTSIPIFIQLALSSWRLREHIIWHDLRIPILIRFITLPLGIMMLYTINSLDPSRIKQFVGIVLLLIVLTQYFINFKPKEHISRLWDIIAFGISGIMLGMIGMGGPPVVVWLMAHDWEPKRIRAFVSFLFLIAAPVQIVLLYWKLGSEAGEGFVWGLASLPLIVIATLTGIHIGNRLDKDSLRQTVNIFLLLIAFVSIVSPYFQK
jgi:uncharacterized membrane protein YfcA